MELQRVLQFSHWLGVSSRLARGVWHDWIEPFCGFTARDSISDKVSLPAACSLRSTVWLYTNLRLYKICIGSIKYMCIVHSHNDVIYNSSHVHAVGRAAPLHRSKARSFDRRIRGTAVGQPGVQSSVFLFPWQWKHNRIELCYAWTSLRGIEYWEVCETIFFQSFCSIWRFSITISSRGKFYAVMTFSPLQSYHGITLLRSLCYHLSCYHYTLLCLAMKCHASELQRETSIERTYSPNQLATGTWWSCWAHVFSTVSTWSCWIGTFSGFESLYLCLYDYVYIYIYIFICMYVCLSVCMYVM